MNKSIKKKEYNLNEMLTLARWHAHNDDDDDDSMQMLKQLQITFFKFVK